MGPDVEGQIGVPWVAFDAVREPSWLVGARPVVGAQRRAKEVGLGDLACWVVAETYYPYASLVLTKEPTNIMGLQ